MQNVNFSTTNLHAVELVWQIAMYQYMILEFRLDNSHFIEFMVNKFHLNWTDYGLLFVTTFMNFCIYSYDGIAMTVWK